ncbi:MAG TPA: MBL fold metallo-hydrolase [Novosphingobium sp.]|jgi:glyoxylase-like metal-dependent hydrolase (beta-lactamase superfamily II)|nr:MBL fold metallo-hydrolase [Novosphingobium sp.]HOA47946.1 MBL fold metallo-hydrolase [Novosphingobium sp.]HPB22633.1 MBL fold metallo-hydrolase [Novosphingobium sp.]HPZ47052.1 MBL fold metallo-hydrolase [Novosphingobium sp.]HQN53766.1 MBL fold metallo-hydrolase [Novosphingobium sp.]
MTDTALTAAIAQIEQSRAKGRPAQVRTFFDPATFTATHVVWDEATRKAAVVDSVLDFDQPSGRTSTASADRVIAFVKEAGLVVEWLLETHAHADHLSAAPYLKEQLGGTIAIGEAIRTVQGVFAKVFNEPASFAADGSQFDRLLADGEQVMLGDLPLIALHVPGHTPACMAYVIGDAVFVGDTLFMPDYGTARCDFPGGDARALYRSVRRLLALPAETRLFLCHDYLAPGRSEYVLETTVAAQRAANVQIHDGISEDEFVAMREARDATLAMPRLILPSVQVNIRAGHFPEPEANGVSYLKLPLNLL